jgi:ABC-type glycerol-3-phosphate transport system substrate-binding protein
MLDYFKALHEDGILAIPITLGETSFNSAPFRGNRSVLTVSSSAGVFNNVPAGGAFQVGVYPVPYRDADNKYVISQGTNMAVLAHRDDDAVLASWLFTRFMTTHPGNTQFAVATGYYPVTYSGLDSAFYQGYLNSPNVNASDKSRIDSAKVNANVYGDESLGWKKFVDPGFVGSSDIRDQVDFVFPILLYGRDGVQLNSQQVIDFILTNLTRYIEA